MKFIKSTTFDYFDNFFDSETKIIAKENAIYNEPFKKISKNNFNNIDLSNKKILNLVSDDKKIFIKIFAPFSHAVIDSLGLFFYKYSKYPDSTFIFDVTHPSKVGWHHTKNMVNFLKIFCNDNNIKYEIVDFYEIDFLIINNDNSESDNSMLCNHINIENMFIFLYQYFKNNLEDFDTNKKVYVSRKKHDSVLSAGFEDLEEFQYISNKDREKIKFLNDKRIDDETKLEQFFKSNGFEIVFPEDFTTFEDQFKYFYNVKTLVAISGASLTNMIFMKPNKNVVEIMTEHTMFGLNYIKNELKHELFTELHFQIGRAHV